MKNTYRFFVAPESLRGDLVHLEDADLAHQLGRVLRLGVGDRVLMLDGSGWSYEVSLRELGRGHVAGQIESRSLAETEPAVSISLFLALMHADRFEVAIQKAVELGVGRIVPVFYARSLPGDRSDSKRLERWRRIIREAAEQSCRGRLPELAEPVRFETACALAAQADLSLILWEGEAPHLRDVLRPTSPEAGPSVAAAGTISILTGPVGGIAPEELTAAREHGIMPVSLGPRILRAETAPLVAIAAICYERGE